MDPTLGKCPKCGSPLTIKTMFQEDIAQCTKCDFKEQVPTAIKAIAKFATDNILEES